MIIKKLAAKEIKGSVILLALLTGKRFVIKRNDEIIHVNKCQVKANELFTNIN